jgi:hypothetical protein
VPQRPDRANRRRRPPDHPPRFLADGMHGARPLVDRHDRRLEEDDPLPAHEHERVGRAEIDRQLATSG